MAEEKQEFKFPTEMVDLPSGGKLYPEEHPLRDGKIEIKYMTAKEEDILTSQNLIKKGVVIDRLLDSLIVSKGVITDDLFVGDKNAVMIASRILAYGGDYTVEVTDPNTGESKQNTFDLTQCQFKELPDDVDYSNNEFKLELPVSKVKITFKLLTGKDENDIASELKSLHKIGQHAEVTTRLKTIITSVNGETSKSIISNFVDNMLSKESLFLRDQIARINPDIDLTQEVDMEGETVSLVIPMTVEFFWPKAGA
jgi:hypothetical protein|tara:strand:+ start:151 stop:912 length:762 start_codon:yes stop_codon:yes gene_type:complete